ncbi:MAG: segregation/condensation protein A [Candidatus Marinimicrobia bacterium]|nr:segregation/condensation protein A [Candidatus Neomarinimicrobiota bacterium]MBL7022628.1 segregation/condensation protein A [Candidatus Neomarinimicrobiota bacterium]MBL7109629.1 segregation/condensation protein A [Candidatus Neomarinimicrobiota bacterium]
MSYRIKLENFEGPLDLLLFFIHRDKLNIYDIPISDITSEFLEYIKLMKILNIQVAGEFIVMASLLMRIKAKMLLPKKQNDDEEEFEDPRDELVKRLLEYKQFKLASTTISKVYEKHCRKHFKGAIIPIKDQKEDMSQYVKNVSLFDLLGIFKEVLERLPDSTTYELNREEIHLDEQIEYLKKMLQSKSNINFKKLMLSLETKLKIIVTFMAILEMIRLKEITVQQKIVFGEIILTGYSK